MSRLMVIAFQANKNNPSDPGNKIAFTLDGHLCGVTDPRAAHDIISAAAREASSAYHLVDFDGLMPNVKFSLVGKHLASAQDFSKITKRC